MTILLPEIGYASTYYRFKYFFSFLKKRQPQIIADVPHRINKNNLLPVLVITKNSDRYPTHILQLRVIIDKEPAHEVQINQEIKQDHWENLTNIDVSKYMSGWHHIDVQIVYKINKKTFSCFNDNYRGTSHEALPCFFSDTDLPQLDGSISGEMHSHSSFTNDQIEFGASVEASSHLAKAIGLNFICITDHSYDLDDYGNDFLKNDPEFTKWHEFQQQVKILNSKKENALIIPGEEVSVLNEKNQNVHILIYNNPQFLEGSGDSGEKWLNYFSKYSISDLLERLDNKALAFAAHPSEKVPFLQKLLLNRASWKQEDTNHVKLTGIQIINGHGKEGMWLSINFWRSLLLSDKKMYAIAGNDAHGNFSRNRSIAIPFINISETYTQLFGLWRTDIFIPKANLDINNIINTLKLGNFSFTNGPAVDLRIFDENNTRYNMGQVCEDAKHCSLQVKSSQEFGLIKDINLFVGDILENEERILWSRQPDKVFESEDTIEINTIPNRCYLRAEIQSQGPKGEHFAFTNPIWIEKKNQGA